MTNPANLKKSILDYAIRGELSAKFRTEFTNLSAYDEINEFNAKISTLKSQREKLLSNLEKFLKTKPKNSDKIKHIIAKLKTKIKSYRTITPLNTDGDFNPPFEIPNSWAWVKLGEICEASGSNVAMKDLLGKNGKFPIYGASGFIQNVNFYHKFNSCIGIVKDGAGVGRIHILPHKSSVISTMQYIEPLKFINLKWFANLLIGLNLSEYANGTTIPHIYFRDYKNKIIPLPPKNEQIYISQILENLLKECENYEAKALNLANLQTKFKSQIPKSILDYAIRGELSAKFRTEFTNLSAYDEIAEFNAKISTLKSQREKLLSNLEKLLKTKPNSRHSERSEESHSLNLDFSPTAQNDSKDKIAQLKRIISKLKTKINSYKTITPLNTAPNFNPPFEIPNSWAWVKLGEICEIKLGKTPPKENASYWTLDKNGYKWVSISDMLDKQTITKTEKFVTKKAKKEIYGNSIARKGTLLLSFKLTIGKTSILGFDGYHNEAIASIIPKMQDREIMKQFLLTFFEIFTKFSNSTTAIKGETLNKDKLNDLPIPLPPKNEQEFIASELEKLLSLCQKLKSE